MRISDWSSDVCSSDLAVERFGGEQMERGDGGVARADIDPARVERVGEPARARYVARPHGRRQPVRDRKSVVEGKSVSVRVDLGGRRIIKKKKPEKEDKYTICLTNQELNHKKIK